MPTHTLRTLSPEDLAFYRKEGYLLVRGVVREETLRLSQVVLERWVEATIQTWRKQGLLTDDFAGESFNRRLLVAWEAAGKPRYSRSPRHEIVFPETYDILAAPEFLDIADDLLGTGEISVHAIFNARPKLPSQRWTDTPWHQDAQYFRETEHLHVPTFWYPLQDVTAHNSCLQVAGGLHRGTLHEGYDDPDTGFLGLSPEARKTLTGIPIEMRRGDVLLFTQMTPHGALPNMSERIRWSMDLRFEDTAQATEKGAALGFVAASERDPASVTAREAWLAKWADLPKGSY